MKKLINFLHSRIKFVLFVYVLMQLVLIIGIESNYGTDAQYYYRLAQDCIEQQGFYPTQKHLYGDYIVAPLYINILIILLKIYNSTFTISIFNFIVVLIQILLLYKITLKIFSENVARLTILLYLFYFNTSALILQNYTELFFLLLISVSIYFYLQNNTLSLIVSGLSLGASIAVRPIGWTLLFAVASIHIYTVIKTKKLVLTYSYFYLGTLAFVLLFGLFIYSHFGKFEYSSTTGPINLLNGANDDATGAFNSTVIEKGKAGYIEHPDSITYLQKEKLYQQKAINWIEEHPVKWLFLSPLKLLHTFGWDDVALTNMFGLQKTNFLKVMRIIFEDKDLNKALPDTTPFYKVFYLLTIILCHLYYYFLVIAIVLGIYRILKQHLSNDLSNIILLFVLFTTLMIMITVGTPRYKYPMFIFMLPFAAFYIDMQFRIGKKKTWIKLKRFTSIFFF